MNKLSEALLVLATPLLLATTKKATKRKPAAKKKPARKTTSRARRPKTDAAHGMSSDTRPPQVVIKPDGMSSDM